MTDRSCLIIDTPTSFSEVSDSNPSTRKAYSTVATSS